MRPGSKLQFLLSGENPLGKVFSGLKPARRENHTGPRARDDGRIARGKNDDDDDV